MKNPPKSAASLSQEELANIGRALKHIEGTASVEGKAGKSKARDSNSKTRADKSKAPVKRVGGTGTIAAKRQESGVKQTATKGSIAASKVKAKAVGGPSKTIAKKPAAKTAAAQKAPDAKGKVNFFETEAPRNVIPENPASYSTKGNASEENSNGVAMLKEESLVRVDCSLGCMPSAHAEEKPSTANQTLSPPRVSMKMTVSGMKAEALVRGHSAKELLGMKKDDLLYFLCDGTICLKDSVEYKAFKALKEKMVAEKDSPDYQKRNYGIRKEAREKERRREAEVKARDLKRQRDLQTARSNMRQNEIRDQAHLHSCFECPSVHQCLLADTTLLRLYGSQRSWSATCNVCSLGPLRFGGYSCDKCGFDICSDCYRHHNLPPAEKGSHTLKVEAGDAKVNAAAEAEEAKAKAAAEAPYAIEQFRRAAVRPSDSAKQQRLETGFTVWCSRGYYNNSFYKSNGPIEKNFDTEWATKEEANERARYLFYWGNFWGIEPYELKEPKEMKTLSGLMKFEETAGDSEMWNVGVVPSSSFLLLDNAISKRHSFDNSRGGAIRFF